MRVSMCVGVSMCVCMCACVCGCVYYVCVCLWASDYLCVCVYLCVYLCVCVRLSICLCKNKLHEIFLKLLAKHGNTKLYISPNLEKESIMYILGCLEKIV